MSGAVIGEHWRVGTVELQVCQARLPCFKLGLRFGDPKMLKLFAQANRPGAYLRILVEGELGAGDAVAVEEPPRTASRSRRWRARSCSTRASSGPPRQPPSCRRSSRAGCSIARPERIRSR